MFNKVYEKIKEYIVNNYKFLISLIVIFCLFTVELPYVIYVPGGIVELNDRIEIEDEYFDYIGVVNLDNDETWRCKHDAKNFLTQLLCDGIHISYTHYWLMEEFYNIIESLINFIDKNDSGEICKNLSGNYEGTRIDVYIYN